MEVMENYTGAKKFIPKVNIIPKESHWITIQKKGRQVKVLKLKENRGYHFLHKNMWQNHKK